MPWPALVLLLPPHDLLLFFFLGVRLFLLLVASFLSVLTTYLFTWIVSFVEQGFSFLVLSRLYFSLPCFYMKGSSEVGGLGWSLGEL